jgi:hypothetical protein
LSSYNNGEDGCGPSFGGKSIIDCDKSGVPKSRLVPSEMGLSSMEKEISNVSDSMMVGACLMKIISN